MADLVRRRLIAALGAAALAARAAPPRRPNVVVILADDLGWRDLGCEGNGFCDTPRIDALAGDGTRWTNAYAAAPVCSPTRAALLTGCAPARLGLTAHLPGHWRPFERLVEPPIAQALPAEPPTIAARLSAAGWTTGHFGKWHLGGAGAQPRDRGFAAGREINGYQVGGERTAGLLARAAEEFIAAHRDRPFLLYLCPGAPHIPLQPVPELLAKYQARPPVAGCSDHAAYAAVVEELDTCVGRVLDALDAQRLAADTLVIFTSDNGGLEREAGGWPGTLNDPLRDEKGSLYEGGLRVPLILRGPNVPAGRVNDDPTITMDLAATILAATGVAGGVPDGEPCLTHPAADRPLFWHYPHYHHSRPAGAMRQGPWKLIEFFDTGAAELYHLVDDPSESRDRAATEPDRAAAMRDRLAAWRREAQAQMPQANPAWDPARAGEWWDRRTIQPTLAPGTYQP